MGGVNDRLDFDIEYTWCWFLGLGAVIMKKMMLMALIYEAVSFGRVEMLVTMLVDYLPF